MADEEATLFGSRQLSTKRFRDVAQAVSRSVEGKGKERVELAGAQRYVVSCNALSDIKLADLGGAEVVRALADRVLLIQVIGADVAACDAALARLRVPGSHLIDLTRAAGHAAWLGETVALPVQRFVGASTTANRATVERAVLTGHVEDAEELYELARAFLDGDASSDAGPFYSKHGALYVDRPALARALEATGKGWDLPRVTNALRPFHWADRDARLRYGDKRVRAWALDAGRLLAALGE